MLTLNALIRILFQISAHMIFPVSRIAGQKLKFSSIMDFGRIPQSLKVDIPFPTIEFKQDPSYGRPARLI